jgi:hypothetical protein
MIHSTKCRSRRLRKKLHIGELEDRAFPIDLSIATRALLFTHDDGRTEKFFVYIWQPHKVGESHWRCPFLIQGDSFEKGGYSAGADSMQALILATHSISSHVGLLARIHDGIFTLVGGPTLGFPDFGPIQL